MSKRKPTKPARSPANPHRDTPLEALRKIQARCAQGPLEIAGSSALNDVWRIANFAVIDAEKEQRAPNIREEQLAMVLPEPTKYVVLVGDIVSGFEAFGPFLSGHEAITWKQSKGVREFTQGQWFLMSLIDIKPLS